MFVNAYERELRAKIGYNPARDYAAAAAGKRKVSFQQVQDDQRHPHKPLTALTPTQIRHSSA